ncbi:MAG TPA: hypothetical protein VF288_10840 [Mycobacteriales bacterium]
MPTVRNTGNLARTWPTLVDAGTGRTLSLAPGETAEVEVSPPGDRFLRVVPAPRAEKAEEPKAEPKDAKRP